MAQDIMHVEYEQLAQIGQSFGQEADHITAMQSQIKAAFNPLSSGDFQGDAAQAFFGEMQSIMFPAIERLITALHTSQTTVAQVSQLIQQAEQEASGLFHGEGTAGTIGGMGGAGGTQEELSGPVGAGNLPAPRIYIVNGINANPNAPLNERGPEQFRQSLIDHGYDPNQVNVTPLIYDTNYHTDLQGTQLQGTHHGGLLSPIDWLTGAGATVINGVTGAGATVVNGAVSGFNTLVGVHQVTQEYTQGANGQYTQRTYNFIQQDLQNNPLLPNQSVVLIGHSGGGAIVGNLTPMIENGLHTDVSGVITMGAPMLNADQILPYARYTNITDRFDFGQPWVRSAEGTGFIPAAINSIPATGVLGAVGTALGGDLLARDSGTTYVWTNSGNINPLAAHGSYWQSDEVLNIIRQQYPDVGQHLGR